MKHVFSASNIVGAILLAYFVYVVIGSFEFSPLPGLFPMVVGGVGIIVIVVHFVAFMPMRRLHLLVLYL